MPSKNMKKMQKTLYAKYEINMQKYARYANNMQKIKTSLTRYEYAKNMQKI